MASKFLLNHPIVNVDITTQNGTEKRQITPYHTLWTTDMQMVLVSNRIDPGALNSLSMDECPTLAMMKLAYGPLALHWIETQIDTINIMSNVTTKMTAIQRRNAAMGILNNYSYLNLAEVCLFMGRACLGKYGDMYSVDALRLCQWLKTFTRELMNAIKLFEDRKREREVQEERERWKREAADPEWVNEHFPHARELVDHLNEGKAPHCFKTSK